MIIEVQEIKQKENILEVMLVSKDNEGKQARFTILQAFKGKNLMSCRGYMEHEKKWLEIEEDQARDLMSSFLSLMRN